jgi:glycosyltransferase involved in cell wall biosynthesis
MMRDSKIGIMCSSIFGYPLKKYFEYMANGCVVVGQMPKNKDELGFKHLHNVCECSIDEIPDVIDFLIKNESIRLKIAKNARDLILNMYTMDHAVARTISEFDRILAHYR